MNKKISFILLFAIIVFGTALYSQEIQLLDLSLVNGKIRYQGIDYDGLGVGGINALPAKSIGSLTFIRDREIGKILKVEVKASFGMTYTYFFPVSKIMYIQTAVGGSESGVYLYFK
jgi:hypothetical protein